MIDEEGHIDLGTQKMHIPGEGGVAQMTGRRVKLALRKRLKDATVTVLVNVYSARRTPSEDNYLDCGIFQDNVTLAQEKPVEIACKLIEEE